MKPYNVIKEDKRWHVRRLMGIVQFMSMSYHDMLVIFKKIGQEQVRKGLQAVTGMTMYCKMDEPVHHKVC